MERRRWVQGAGIALGRFVRQSNRPIGFGVGALCIVQQNIFPQPERQRIVRIPVNVRRSQVQYAVLPQFRRVRRGQGVKAFRQQILAAAAQGRFRGASTGGGKRLLAGVPVLFQVRALLRRRKGLKGHPHPWIIVRVARMVVTRSVLRVRGSKHAEAPGRQRRGVALLEHEHGVVPGETQQHGHGRQRHQGPLGATARRCRRGSMVVRLLLLRIAVASCCCCCSRGAAARAASSRAGWKRRRLLEMPCRLMMAARNDPCALVQ